jgi:ankyrin repeat protein
MEFVKALIEGGAEIDPDTLLKDPLTPLQAACITGNLEIVDPFLKRGADINRVY